MAPPDRPNACGWQSGGPDWSARGERIGWASGEDVYLDPNAAFAAVQRTAAAHRDPITMTARTLWKRMHERGLLASVDPRGGKTRHTVRVTLAGVRVGVLHLHRSVLFPPAEGGPSGPAEADARPIQEAGGATDRATPTADPAGWPTECPAAAPTNPGPEIEVGHSGHPAEADTPDPVEYF